MFSGGSHSIPASRKIHPNRWVTESMVAKEVILAMESQPSTRKLRGQSLGISCEGDPSAGSGPAGVPRSVRATQLPLGSPCPWEQCSCPLCGTQPRLWCLPMNATCRSHNGSTTSSMCTAVTFLTLPSARLRMLLSSYNNKISLPLEVNPNFHWSVITITHHKKHLIFNLYNRSIPTNTSASLHAVQVAT